MPAEKVLISWSGGKDACLALWQILGGTWGDYEVSGLITTVARENGRVPVHGVRRELLEAQALSLNLPLRLVEIRKGASNAEYERALRVELLAQREAGVCKIVFGDLFLADVRAYRERLLEAVGVRGLFPLWGRDTARLAAEFDELGFKAVVVAIAARALDRTFAGRAFDYDFLAALPPQVDPCGERGEFHTFVFDGPLFRRAVEFERSGITEEDGHFVCELSPPHSAGPNRD